MHKNFWDFPKFMIYISRKEHFNAAHKLFNPSWSEEKNAEVFGPCANHNWHGHNFELIVTVRGLPDPSTGFVINLKDLSKLTKALVIDELDHKNLNLDVPFLKDKLCSCETIIVEIWNILAPAINATAPNAELYQLRLFETPRNYVDYYGSHKPL